MANLPVFFLHGAIGSAAHGIPFDQFAIEQRPVVHLNFAENTASYQPLPDQVQLAIQQIRNYTSNDSRFNNGYTIIAHSMGGVIARGVIEEMDDHNVKVLITLGSSHSGVCHGPQADPSITKQFGVELLNSHALPINLFDFSSYSNDAVQEGRMLVDLMEVMQKHPEITQNSSISSLLRYPVRKIWLDLKSYLSTIDNLQMDDAEHQRRKRNFLKLEELHAFTSPQDGILEPYQSGVFGYYTEVADSTELLAKYKTLEVVDLEDTVEYKENSYGLRTLDERGGLFRYVVDQVPHMCWVEDTGDCKVNDLVKAQLGPILK
ncbi:hypothetical protein Poli38472_010450 [Pythium oligandrum]|uniref:Uncharacterized protein n=1 Tax=Pythium oligandrum TaxID=41045 RepID=A0A8K1C397_PYTOL|nr:hypothetical protein Poli38472_010450 [Pythium oligandrum]|eukprot:TMW55568.1 hypothetical protein Poli38472_010450 [Pythium oligandrum]